MHRPSQHLAFILPVIFLTACGGAESALPRTVAPAPAPEPVARRIVETDPPLGQLPSGVSPTHYNIAIQVVPDRESFHGVAIIQADLEHRTRQIWLHGRDFTVSRATIESPTRGEQAATWEEVPDSNGVASLSVEQVLEPGPLTITVHYRANFGTQLRGLYRVEEGEDAYAFTQFEPTSARQAFPCFDEPRFKTPFDLTLIVDAEDVAAANTPIAEEVSTSTGMRRVRFETSRPMPTYLVAVAVGPLDVVEVDPIPANQFRDRPLPLRGIAARGRGERMAYALEHTGALLANLEEYFGSPYPYAKLDIVAVPDFASGAMENVGLVTFRESLLLLGDGTGVPAWQSRAYAYVMAHELAHMWFGNLVTMPWWDDLWLNEAFATWMGMKVVAGVFPEYQVHLGMVEATHRVMGSDSRVSARQIRQPIETNHDIPNAFDGITYRKGGAVLEMIERWIGVDTFREGMRLYMRRHAWGNAVADDLLAALDEASGRDVSGVFRTFLYQPGLPLLQTELNCEESQATLSVQQSRYLPAGSTGDAAQSWTLPVCVRFGRGGEAHTQCQVISEVEEDFAFEGEGCPDWVMPNANASGYYRFAMSAEAIEGLRESAWGLLSDAERIAVADSLRAGFQSGVVSAADFLEMADELASDPLRQVAGVPMGVISFVRSRLVDSEMRSEVQEWAGSLYNPAVRQLGWGPRSGSDEEQARGIYRASVLSFMAETVQDSTIRRQGARLGVRFLGYGRDGAIDREAVDPNLVGLVTRLAVQEGNAQLWEYVLERMLEETDPVVRGSLLSALASTRDTSLAARARALSLDERLRVNELMSPLWRQMGMEETREDTWTWATENLDALIGRVGGRGAGRLPYLGVYFCDAEDAESVRAVFGPRVESLPGAPRNLATALESIQLCAARVEAQRDAARGFFQDN